VTSELTLVVPTYNEAGNVEAFTAKAAKALEGIDWELVFVDDDSPDGTAKRIRQIAEANPRVRCLLRVGRRGLSSACIEGIMSTGSPFVAVMDADLQHDEGLLPAMLDILRQNEVDIVIASRYMEGGGVGDWDAGRALISKLATGLTNMVVRTRLSDPMSGFFMVRRDAFEGSVRHMSGTGFKIQLDLIASSPEPLRIRELPFNFRTRHAGISKLDSHVALDFFQLLLEKTMGRVLPIRFLMFVSVGGLGVVVHLMALGVALNVLGAPFGLSQATAVLIAMTFNFTLNNSFTYRDRRLHGMKFITGLLSFYLACGIGGIINYSLAVFAFDQGFSWWLAGIMGAAVGAVWNFATTSILTWRK